MSWHGIIVILQWLIFAAGVFTLVRRSGWSVGAVLMAGSLIFQAVGGLGSIVAVDAINHHQAFWIPMLAWSVSVLGFASGFLLVCIERREPIQSPQQQRP
jgi:hypothetical protein